MLRAWMETVGDRRVRVARLGQGPPLVLLHGYPDTLHVWSEVAPRLAGHFDVVAFDWPGMGDSEAWPGGATPDHMADRLRDLLDAWTIDQAVVVGLDMGGQPALSFAARFPERAAAVAVMNSLVLPDEVTSWEIRLMRRFAWNRFLLRHAPRLVFLRARSTFLRRGRSLPSGLRSDFWRCFRRPDVRAFIARMCAGYQGTLARLPALYPRIRCPTLALWGECDRHFPPRHGQRLAEAVPGGRFVVLEGAGHWMVVDRAADVAAALRAFLKDANPFTPRGLPLP